MGSSGTCEIVEAREELNLQNSGLRGGERNGKLPVLNLGYKHSLEDDINKLFESITLKSPSKGSRNSQFGTSPKMKNVLKKPITMGVPQSPQIGSSEPMTLKKALRDLCISKASEMAATKRLSKPTGSTASSEAGRIKTLYNAVVAESSRSAHASAEGKRTNVEITLVSEECKSCPSNNLPQPLQENKVMSSCQTICSLSEFSVSTNQNGIGSSSMQNEIVNASREMSVQSSKGEDASSEKETTSIREKSNIAMEVELQTSKEEHASTSERTHALPQSCSSMNDSILELVEDPLGPTKTANEALVSNPCRERKLRSLSSSLASVNGNRVRKLSRSNPRAVKPLIRNKNKKKFKQDSVSTSPIKCIEVDNDFDPGAGQLVCERCHCTLKAVNKEKNQSSLKSYPVISGDRLDSNDMQSSASKPVVTSNNINRTQSKPMGKIKKNMDLREKSEFSQSSKSSQGEYSSTSTSTSDDSNVSGLSCGNRPHMSKDVRWEAIQHVRMQDGVLGSRHFNLLKKLGCGDIGMVYLAELTGTNCLFAIKVMDNEFLARRKKMPRAQTEREILRMLDHPFLPTLYAQFTTGNLSCLVMEYCPGGDLHVLRQRQPGRYFLEPAARFYVAEVLLALEYLHMLGVVYRDLKPENILVREDGHIMLTDFDLSLRCTVSPTLLKSSSELDPARISHPCAESSCMEPFCIEPSCQVPCFSPRFLPSAAKTRKLKADLAAVVRSLPQLVAEPTDARSNSFVGTHEYLAPEIIKGEGHGAAVDWWTFGVFLFELLYGRTPFKGSNNEETLANVVLQNLGFPDSPFVSFQARDLIRRLLVKEPENRLGTEKGAAEIKQHPFFEGLNWALIRCAMPPELPEFCDFGVSEIASQVKSKYLECKATGEHVEFELF